MKPGEYGIVLGNELAKALGVRMGERVVIVTSLRTTTPAGVMPRMRTFKVVGLFSAGMYEYDRNPRTSRRCSAPVPDGRRRDRSASQAGRHVRGAAWCASWPLLSAAGITSTTGAASMRPSSVRSS